VALTDSLLQSDDRGTKSVCRRRSIAPDFSVTDMDGQPIHLADLKGKCLPTPGQSVVDFGHCLLRLDAATAG